MAFFMGQNEDGIEVFTGNGSIVNFDNEGIFKVAIPSVRERTANTSDVSSRYVHHGSIHGAGHLQKLQ